jgi:hypothetical protein
MIFRWGKDKYTKKSKAKYDLKYPVVTVRLPAALKDQLRFEAKKRGLGLSNYIRSLLQEIGTREGVFERGLKKGVTKPGVKTTEISDKDTKIAELKDQVDKLRASFIDLENIHEDLKTNYLSLNDMYKNLITTEIPEKVGEINELLAKNKELENSFFELKKEYERVNKVDPTLSTNYDSLLKDYNTQLEMVKDLQAKIEGLMTNNDLLKRQLEWATAELKSIDKQNRRIARKMANTKGIRIGYARTEWGKMPRK